MKFAKILTLASALLLMASSALALPKVVTTLHARAVSADAISLGWPAPDNGSGSACTSYQLRYATTAIYDTNAFNAATVVNGMSGPSAPGAADSVTVTGLAVGRMYWFAVRGVDASGSPGPLYFPSFFRATLLPRNIIWFPQNGGEFYNSATNQKTDSLGYVLVSTQHDPSGAQPTYEVSKDRDTFLNQVIIDDSTSVGSPGDSTSVPVYTAPYGRQFLHFKMAAGANYLATKWVKLAVQVSGGYAANKDTTAFQSFLSSRTGVPGDSLGVQYGSVDIGSPIVAHADEFVVTVPFNDGNSTGGYVELPDHNGLPYWAPYTVVRIRTIAASVAANGATFPWYRLTVRLIGRPF